jgi:tetratricopeptide (TPR) repeat protein
MRLPMVLAGGAALALTVAVAPGAFAQPRRGPAPTYTDPTLAEAKRLFEDGAAAYATGNYEAAIKMWERSYELSHKPLIFESLANAWERLGDAKKTRDYLARWRASAPVEERPGLDIRIQNLDTRIAREDDAASRAAAAQAAREAALRGEAEQGRQQPWLLGAIVGGAGVAAVIAGVVVDVLANGKRPPASSCTMVSGQNLCLTSASSAISLSNRMAIAGDATWIVGAAAVATGAVLVILRRSPPPPDAGPQQPGAALPPPAAYLAPLPGGLMLGGSF